MKLLTITYFWYSAIGANNWMDVQRPVCMILCRKRPSNSISIQIWQGMNQIWSTRHDGALMHTDGSNSPKCVNSYANKITFFMISSHTASRQVIFQIKSEHDHLSLIIRTCIEWSNQASGQSMIQKINKET